MSRNDTHPRGARLRASGSWPLAACTLLVLAMSGAAAAQFSIRVLDEASYDAAPDAAFDPNNTPLVAYRSTAEHALKLARAELCTSLDALYAENDAGNRPALAVDSLGLVHVVHTNPDGAVYYTLDGGALFGRHTIALPIQGPFASADFALDASDRPYVVCRATQSNQPPRLLRFDISTGTWQSEVVAGPAVANLPPPFGVPVIAVNHASQPVVAYVTSDPNLAVVVATRGAEGWTIRRSYPASPTTPHGWALAIDSVDAPCVAISFGSRIDYCRFGVFDVSVQSIGVSGYAVVGRHGLALDGGDRARLAYATDSDRCVYLATNELGWYSALVESGAFDGTSAPAVAIDGLGCWALTYFDWTHAVVKVAGLGLGGDVPGDVNCDGAVDALDWVRFAACLNGPDLWTPPPGVSVAEFDRADLDRDVDVDMADFAAFQAQY